LVQDPSNAVSQQEAEKILKTTNAAGKNELLFTRFGVNYNKEPAMFRKGSILFRISDDVEQVSKTTGKTVTRSRKRVAIVHDDFISDTWWAHHPDILNTDVVA
jgi:tRNA(His) guanylyltransferase